MPRPQVIITPEATLESLAEAVLELQRLLTKGLGIGDAGGGNSLARIDTSTPVRPLTQLGEPDNLLGSLVQVNLVDGDLNTNLKCDHNLQLDAPASRPGPDQLLNVRWIVAGIRYLSDDYGTDLAANSQTVLAMYADGAVGENSIELRFFSDLDLTGTPAQTLVVTLFFFPASA